MAMMIPDYALVAGDALLRGIEDFKDLSRKMTSCTSSRRAAFPAGPLRFGMRALKSLLVMAGALKRGSRTLTSRLSSSTRSRCQLTQVPLR